MRRHRSFLARQGLAAFLLALFLGVSAPSPARASPPANDNLADAQAITSFPFSDSGDLNGTTTEPGEPQPCASQVQTVWYTFTAPSSAAIAVDAIGSDARVSFNVWQSSGGGFGGLNFVGCSGTLQPFQLNVQVGAIYYIQVGSVDFGSIPMQLHVAQVQGPANDYFADATSIGLPTLLGYSGSQYGNQGSRRADAGVLRHEQHRLVFVHPRNDPDDHGQHRPVRGRHRRLHGEFACRSVPGRVHRSLLATNVPRPGRHDLLLPGRAVVLQRVRPGHVPAPGGAEPRRSVLLLSERPELL